MMRSGVVWCSLFDSTEQSMWKVRRVVLVCSEGLAGEQSDSDLVRKATSNGPAHAVSPFRGEAAICHNDKVATPLQSRTRRGEMLPRNVVSSRRKTQRTDHASTLNMAWIRNGRAKMRKKMSKLPERQETKEKMRTRAPKNS